MWGHRAKLVEDIGYRRVWRQESGKSENVHMAVPHVNFPIPETPVNGINGDGVMTIMADMDSASSILLVNPGTTFNTRSNASKVIQE